MLESAQKLLASKEKLLKKIIQLEESLSELKKQEEDAVYKLGITKTVLTKFNLDFFVVDEKGLVLDASEFFMVLFGSDGKSLLGKSILELTNNEVFDENDFVLLEYNFKDFREKKHRIYIKKTLQFSRNIDPDILISLIPYSTVLLNSKGIIVNCNNKIINQLDFSFKYQLIGKIFSDFIVIPENIKIFDFISKNSLVQIISSKGKKSLSNIMLLPVEIDSDFTLNMLIIKDISLKNKPNVAIPEAAHNILNLLPQAVAMIKENGDILEINKSFGDFFQINLSGNSGPYNIFNNIIFNKSSIIDDFEECMYSGEPLTNKKTILSVKGKKKFTEYTIVPVKNDGGVVERYVITLSGISKELAEQEELLRILVGLENTGVAIVTTDKNLKINYVNKSALTILGFNSHNQLILL